MNVRIRPMGMLEMMKTNELKLVPARGDVLPAGGRPAALTTKSCLANAGTTCFLGRCHHVSL